MLTPRIEKIISFVEGAGTVADIGCDHGYAVLGLLEQGRARKVIACDISAPSLRKAEEMARTHCLVDRVETRLGDGLSVLEPGEADVIIIAGVGGMRICDILQQGAQCAGRTRLLVLAPNRNEYEVRKYVCENGFMIVEEGLAHDNGRYYQIICAVPSENAAQQGDLDYYIGKRLVEGKDPLLKGFLDCKLAELDSILKQAGNGKDTQKYTAGMIERKRRMEEVRKCL